MHQPADSRKQHPTPPAAGGIPGRAEQARSPSAGPHPAEKAVWLLIAILGMGALAGRAARSPADPDELEHLHASWLWSRGLTPYVEFFEHHPPAYWVVLRPLVAGGGTANLETVVWRARLTSWLLAAGSVAGAWWLFGSLFGRRAAWYGAGLWAAVCGSLDHAMHVRPDMLMLVLLVFGTALAVDGAARAGRSRRAWVRMVVGGVLLGTATCVLPKAVFWAGTVAAVLLAVGGYVVIRRRRWAGLVAASLLLGGMAVPGAVQLAWILRFNDFDRFWFCNVTANGQLAGCLLDNVTYLKAAVGGLIGTAALPALLAVLGAVRLARSDGESSGLRGLMVAGLVVSSVVLVVLGAGPFVQYFLPFLLLVAGLAGLGWQAATEHWGWPGRTAAAGAVLVLFGVLAWAGRPGKEMPALKTSLAPLQHVLDRARPGDTYVGVTQFNPVFVMDADPRRFMYLLCFQDDRSLQDVLDVIILRRPRFVVGFGGPLWMGARGIRTVQPSQALAADYEQVMPLVLERRRAGR